MTFRPNQSFKSAPLYAPIQPSNTMRSHSNYNQVRFGKEPMPESKCPICGRQTLEHYPTLDLWRCYGGKCRSEFFYDANGTINVRDFMPERVSLIENLWFNLKHRIKLWWTARSQVRPKIAPPPIKHFDFTAQLARLAREEAILFASNPTAIWLAPDRWDGPAAEPFWMRDPKPVTIPVDTTHISATYPVAFGSTKMEPTFIYQPLEGDAEFTAFFASPYKTLAAFRRAKTIERKTGGRLLAIDPVKEATALRMQMDMGLHPSPQDDLLPEALRRPPRSVR